MHSNIGEEAEELLKDKRSGLFVASHNMGALKAGRLHTVNELRGAEGVGEAKIHSRAPQGGSPAGGTLQAAVSRPLG